MPERRIHTHAHLKSIRSILRKSLTPAEATLWTALKNNQLVNRKFRRQHSIENYVVDFYCAEEKLIVELDGQGHYNAIAALNDEDRDHRLTELGFRILRFENKLVYQNLEGVLDEIKSCFKDQIM